MLNPDHVPPIAAPELLARFIYSSKHIRNSDNSVKPEAFMPHPYIELSMTRHIEASIDEVWAEGERIAGLRRIKLYGRADAVAVTFTDQELAVEAAPLPENPNHANATKWPADKPAQKIKAIEIAVRSQLVRR